MPWPDPPNPPLPKPGSPPPSGGPTPTARGDEGSAVISVPKLGQPMLPRDVTDAELGMIIGGLLIANQATAKKLAKYEQDRRRASQYVKDGGHPGSL
jgi:hypothetical protein